MELSIDNVINNCIFDNQNSFENCKISSCENEVGKGYEKFECSGEKLSNKMMISSCINDNQERETYIKNNSHVIGIGCTGSGKTQCYINPQLEFMAKYTNSNFFIVDIKGEIYRNKVELLKQEGYEVLTINLSDPYSSNKFNPLYYPFNEYKKAVAYEESLKSVRTDKSPKCKEFLGNKYNSSLDCQNAIKRKILESYDNAYSSLKILSEILVPITSLKEPSWDYASRDIVFRILCGMLEDTKFKERKMNKNMFTLDTLNSILVTKKNDYAHVIRWYNSHPLNSESRKLAGYFEIYAEKTRDSYASNTIANINRFINLPTKYLTSSSDFDMDEICEKINNGKIAIFCILDETKPITFEITMMFITQLLDTVKRYADLNGGSLDKDFHLFLDEFCNMPALPNIERLISTFRSRKIWLHMMIQSIAQLDYRYGNDIRTIIMDNANTHIFFGSNNIETLNMFASSFGSRCGAVSSYSITSNCSMIMNVNSIEERVVKVSDLMNLKLGEAYVKCLDAPSIKTYITPDFMSKDLFHGNSIPTPLNVDLSIVEKKSYDIISIMNKYESSHKIERIEDLF